MEQVGEVGHDSKGIKRSYSDAMPCDDDGNKAKKPVPEVASPNLNSGNGNAGTSQPLVSSTDSNSTDKSKSADKSPTGIVYSTDPSKDAIVFVNGESKFPSFYGALLSTMKFSELKLCEDFGKDTNKRNKDVFTCTYFYKQDESNGVILADGTAFCKIKAKKRASEGSFEVLLKACYTIISLRQSNLKNGISFRAMNEGQFKFDVNQSDNSAANTECSDGEQGKDGSEAMEPVQSKKGPDRMTPEFCAAADHFIHEYAQLRGVEDLVFWDDMLGEQRYYVKKLVLKNKDTLTAKFLGEAPNRHVVVSSKFGPFELLKKLLVVGKNERYEVHPPNTLNTEQFKNLFKFKGKPDFSKKHKKYWRKQQRQK